jgi:hypothetical protein
MPTEGRGGTSQLDTGTLLDTDPDVDSAGVEVGYTPDKKTLRAPDISVGGVPRTPGFVSGAPPLAVEYADSGQDEADLKLKVNELLRAGTKLVWVVRLTGLRRVEVHAPGVPVRTFTANETLVAPGILRNSVPVIALFERKEAFRATLRNLVQREGYESFEAALEKSRDEGKASGKASALVHVLRGRALQPTPEELQRIEACHDSDELDRWLGRAGVVERVAQLWE